MIQNTDNIKNKIKNNIVKKQIKRKKTISTIEKVGIIIIKLGAILLDAEIYKKYMIRPIKKLDKFTKGMNTDKIYERQYKK